MAILVAYVLGVLSAIGMFAIISLLGAPGDHLTGPESNIVFESSPTTPTNPILLNDMVKMGAASVQPAVILTPAQIDSIDHAYAMIQRADATKTSD